jgi:hypothetical protein
MLLIKACLLGYSLFRRVSFPCIHLVCVTGCSSSPILLCICWTWSLLTVGCRTMATCVRWAAIVPSLEAWSLRSLLSKRGPRPPVFFSGHPCCLVRSLRSRNRPGPERSLDACAWSSCRLLFPPRPTTGLCLSLSSNSNLTAESRWALYFSTLHSYWRWWYCAIFEFSTIRADLFYFRHPRFCWELEDYILGRFFDSWILDLISHDPIQVLAVLMLVDSFEYK